MDIVYYSNYCKHSQKLIAYLVKHDLVKNLNCINVDKRRIDTTSGQTYVILENGTSILLPPNVHSVPALLLVKKNYNVVLGDAILSHFQTQVSQQTAECIETEPCGYSFSNYSNKAIVSEQYTFYSATPEELSTKGMGGARQMHNYVSADGHSTSTIKTPPDTYRPNKLSDKVTIDSLQTQRNEEIGHTTPSFLPPSLQPLASI
jgi:uncharacterized Fe-S cluster protein YjdI